MGHEPKTDTPNWDTTIHCECGERCSNWMAFYRHRGSAYLQEGRDTIIEVLCSQALADHLGDVRDTEEKLWNLLGVPPLPYDDPAWDSDSPYDITHARLKAAGLDVPAYLRGDDD